MLPRATDSDGRFVSPVDSTLARRHPVTVVDVSRARVGGRALTDAEQRAVRGATGGISVAYRLSGVTVSERNGNVVVSGRATRADGAAVPTVILLSYRLSGRITDSAGNPIRGATVVTRSNDRDFWTFSEPSDANGRYNGFFPASDKSGNDPVEFAVQIAYGRTSYTTGARNPSFKRLSSATMDVRLPASGIAAPLPTTTAVPGAIYRGLLVGVSGRNGLVKPISATWPDARGRFTIVLPAEHEGADAPVLAERVPDLHDRGRPGAARSSWPGRRCSRLASRATPASCGSRARRSGARGSALRSRGARHASPVQSSPVAPGDKADLGSWPSALSPRVSRDVGFVRAPRR